MNGAAKACRHAATKRESNFFTNIQIRSCQVDLALKLFASFFSISAHGDHKAENLLHELARKAGLIEGRRVDAEFMSYWRRRFL